ncbi:MAG: hypothetical protein OEV59_03645 [Deltaproteobacteria bacterium]|nr:hypothetical protein [Deltaproteobacteria bacterium]
MLRAICLAALFVLLAGCVSAPAIKPDCAAAGVISTLRITALIKHENSENAARAVMYVRRPDAMRFEVYGAMNRRIAIIAASDKGCAYYSEGSVRDCDESNGSNPLTLLTAREVVEFLFDDRGAFGGILSDSWQLERSADGRIAKAVKAVGPLSVVVTLGGYEETGCVMLPRSMRVESRGESFEIVVKGAKPNVDLDDGAFELVADPSNP